MDSKHLIEETCVKSGQYQCVCARVCEGCVCEVCVCVRCMYGVYGIGVYGMCVSLRCVCECVYGIRVYVASLYHLWSLISDHTRV